MKRQALKILHGALDVEGESILLRGRIDPTTLDVLEVDDYQREIMPLSTIRDIMEGFTSGEVPDVELGMRGDNVTNTKDNNGQTFVLKGSIYIVDGLQRVTAARQLRLNGVADPRLGATVHFNTTREWEIERFKILNAHRTKLSPNILLRNLREKYSVIAMLFNMSADDRKFVMRQKVCWQQRQQRIHLISALTLLKVVGAMHSHVAPGARYSRWLDLAQGVQEIMSKVGRNIFQQNVRAFFDLIDNCWGIQNIAYKEGAAYMRSSFLLTLARVFSEHDNFWREKRFFVDADLVRKIASFPVTDPTVRQLAGSGGKSREMLYAMIVEHINRGKRSRRLEKRRGM